jgi:alginate O-acetyltransferase complex protein AlgI
MTLSGATDPAFVGWLVVAVAAYWAAPARSRSAVLAATTAAFMAAADARSLVILGVFTAIVVAATRRHGLSTLAAMVGVVVVLFGFKAVDPERGLIEAGPIIPLGLSFYALRCLHVLAEYHLDEIPAPTPRQLVAYLFFLPTIVAGPVHRYPPFVATPPRLDWPRISLALERLLHGYAKIIIVSNYLLGDKIFPSIKPRFVDTSAAYQYLDCLDVGLNLYLQFSGYSDVAIAVALLFGYEVAENFDWPLLRSNLTDFWRTWHMSVTSWCRQYVFTGVFALTRRRWLGMLATMLSVGVWHGTTLNFLAWGLYHGLGLVATQAWSAAVLKPRRLSPAMSALVTGAGWLITFNFVMIGFAWTKEPTLAASLTVFGRLLHGATGR